MQKSQEEISSLLPSKDEYKVDTSEFQDVKARLNAFENRRKLQDKDDKAPSLRRSNRAGGNGGDDSDHPVLRRRDDSGSSQPGSTTSGGNSGDDNGPPVLKRPPQQ